MASKSSVATEAVKMPKEKPNYKSLFTVGIWKDNAVFKMFLALCPALGVTTTVLYSFSMGLITLLVMVLSSLLVALLGKWIPSEIRIPILITIIATSVTIFDMITQAFMPDVHSALGAFIALTVSNCIVLGRAEGFAMKNRPFAAVVDAFGYGLGITVAFVLIGLFREVLGTGSISMFGETLRIFPNQFAISFFTAPMGAFIAIGVIMGIVITIQLRKEDEKLAKEKAERAVKTKANKTGGA